MMDNCDVTAGNTGQWLLSMGNKKVCLLIQLTPQLWHTLYGKVTRQQSY